ncbi:FAD-binding domain-containing protein [Clostridium baratii]|uniref:sulfide/dihydroorotate dehydrogenase-like FAD/NAD-binding protein n=1 Tax=Clostridium baratii TaxID=1561 RepID=UPI0006C666D6|nr:sulfide/dihydroorotate dehydrogenase-like FAD/NAD-binding protein [Clostridium baratii]CUP03465.1 FAD-binding domain-containing protein [Clostridium baratii]
MIREATDCIDAGSEYCPCKLAEMGECILCSQMHGECFCDCLNWKGVCIYQEFSNNGMKAKEGREKYSSKILDYSNFNNELIIIKLSVTHKIAVDLINPGGYVFLCPDLEKYFDTPISVMESDTENNTLTVAIEIRGIKTKKLLELKVGDTLDIRGPYWNGIFGLKNIEKQKGTDCLILARGMGLAPMMPLVRKLSLQECNVNIAVDNGGFKEDFITGYLEKYKVNTEEGNLLERGNLSEFCKELIDKNINSRVKYIHIAGADILTFKVIEYLDSLDRKDVLLSCCNNFKMCCGEGICGACTARYKGHRVKRFCKVQTDPRSIFEERRLI